MNARRYLAVAAVNAAIAGASVVASAPQTMAATGSAGAAVVRPSTVGCYFQAAEVD